MANAMSLNAPCVSVCPSMEMLRATSATACSALPSVQPALNVVKDLTDNRLASLCMRSCALCNAVLCRAQQCRKSTLGVEMLH